MQQPRIFINYRREDSPGSAGRLFDRLAEEIPQAKLFMDVDAIAPGVDFVHEIEQAVSSCDVLLVIIGRGWLTATDRLGRRRLDLPEDFVRLEIATALTHEVRVVPVLVDGAAMPAAADLPEELRPLVRRNGVELSHQRFATDTRHLARALVRNADEPEPPRASAAGGRRATPAPAAAIAVAPSDPLPTWRVLAAAATVFAIMSSGAIVGFRLVHEGTDWWFLRLSPAPQIWVALNAMVGPALALKLWIPRLSLQQLAGVVGATLAALVALSALPQVLQPIFLSYFPADPQHGVDTLLWAAFVDTPILAACGVALGYFLGQALRGLFPADGGPGFVRRMIVIWTATGMAYGVANYLLVSLAKAVAGRADPGGGAAQAAQQQMLMLSDTVLFGLVWALGLLLTLRLAPRQTT